MDMLNDPAMKEIVDGFCEESLELLDQLEETLDELEDDPTNSELLEKFGQVIDRMMGGAKSIGADEIATFSELGKVIGYKSSQVNDPPLLAVVVAILFDAVDLIRKMVIKIQTKESDGLQNLNTEAFGTRLRWLSEKFKNIERASVSYTEQDAENAEELDQSSIDDLMASLGL